MRTLKKTLNLLATATVAAALAVIFAGPMVKSGQYPEPDINLANPDTSRTGGTVTLTGTAMNHYNTAPPSL